MRRIADGLYLLDGWPRNAINVYLMGGVLVDAGTRWAKGRILKQLAKPPDGQQVVAHALTHAHPDHQGSSKAVCEALGLELWCGAGDAKAMETGDHSKIIPDNWNTRLQHRFWTGPPYRVARKLHEGDIVGGFKVIETPGHSPGHVAFWREKDRVLVLGDVMNGMNLLTGVAGIHEPPLLFTVDPEENRRSIRKLGSLNPAIVCFGHGPVLKDGRVFAKFCERCADELPAAAMAAAAPPMREKQESVA